MGTRSRICSTSSPNPASARRSAARPRTRPWAQGHALIPVASTPTTRRDVVPLATAIPIRDTISCVTRSVTGVCRRSGHRATMRTSARSALCRSTIWDAIRWASTSTRSPSPSTTSSIAWSNSSGKRDMWTPFWSRARSTVQSISAAMRISWSPRRMRIALCTPVTPARESASPTGGADACMSPTRGSSAMPDTVLGGARLAEERDHRPGEARRILHRREVRDPGELREPRAGDLVREEPRDPAEARLVERADEDERRRPHVREALAATLRQPPPLRLGVLVVEREPLHLEDALTERRVDVLLAAGRPIEPRPHVDPGRLVEVAALEGLLLLLPRRHQALVVLPAVDPRVDEDEVVDPVGVRESEVERHVAAHRDADHVRALDPERLEQGGGVRRVDERAVRERRLPVAAEIAADDAEPLGERGQDVVPHAPVGDPGVEQQQRRAGARLVVGQVDAVELRGRHQRRSRDSRRSFRIRPPVCSAGQ